MNSATAGLPASIRRALRHPLRTGLAAGCIGFGLVLLGLLAVAMPRATLRSPAPSVMPTDRHGVYLGEVNVPDDGRLGFWRSGDRRCTALEEGDETAACLPSRVVAATLAIEDRRFDVHAGVDPVAVARAVRQNLTSGERISGASTIAMQVARLQDPGARTWSRKAIEAVTALLLVDRYGREAVLAQYLTRAPYGNNVHGVRYAARRYFKKPLSDLTWAEASLLAALPQAPGQMNLYDARGRRRAARRANQILDQLHVDGTIDAVTLDASRRELAVLTPGVRPHRPEAAISQVLALDTLLPDVVRPELQTTLDLSLQEHTEYTLLDWVHYWRPRGAGQSAAVIAERLDDGSLAVRASVGSVGYRGTEAGSIDFTRVPRTPGSTLKPFLYARALDTGQLTPDTILDDLTFGPEGIRNSDDSFLGPMLPRAALANSRNVPTVRLAEQVGLVEVYDHWHRLGLHDASLPAEHYGLALAIGGMPVTLQDLVRAYGALANDGQLRDLVWFDEPDRAGLDVSFTGQRVFSPDHARLITQWLADPVARTPTFPRAGVTELPFPAAIKTGTSPDYRDSWALAITDRYVVGVWLGHPDWRPMQGLGGYGGSGRILRELLLHLHAEDADGLANTGLIHPEGWTEHTVCAHTGALATDHCDAPRTELFAPGHAPVHDCEAHRLEDGRVVTDLPSRYASWMASAGITPAPRAEVTPETPVSIELIAPMDGTRVIRDPEVPASRSTLKLAAAVDPPVGDLVWYVDGVPFATVGAPYEVRWPIQPGAHTFEARLAYRPERSSVVAVEAL